MPKLKMIRKKKYEGKEYIETFTKTFDVFNYSDLIDKAMQKADEIENGSLRKACEVEMLSEIGLDEYQIAVVQAIQDAGRCIGTSLTEDLLTEANYKPWTDERKVSALYRYAGVTLEIDDNPLFFDDGGTANSKELCLKSLLDFIISFGDSAWDSLYKYPRAFQLLKSKVDAVQTAGERSEKSRHSISEKKKGDNLQQSPDKTSEKNNRNELVMGVINEIMKPYADEGYDVYIVKLGDQLYADLEMNERYIRTIRLPFELDIPAGKRFKIKYNSSEKEKGGKKEDASNCF